MSQRLNHIKSLKVVLPSLLLAAGLPVLAAPARPAAVTKTNSLSVFILPTSPKEGRDPFYPSSTRPYQSAAPTNTRPAEVNLGELSLQGISGLPPNRLVIINKRTFAQGDYAEVSTTKGRLHVH